jgi:hypothetical protein
VALRLLGLLCMAQREMGFEHGDIKPANIVVNEQGRPLLIDYDLVRFRTGADARAQPHAGTIVYRAPDGLRKRPFLGSADMWALGLTLISCMVGEELNIDSAKRAAALQLLLGLEKKHEVPDYDDVMRLRPLLARLPGVAMRLLGRLLDPRQYMRAIRNDAYRTLAGDIWLRRSPEHASFLAVYGDRLQAPWPEALLHAIGCAACGSSNISMCADTGLLVCSEHCWRRIKGLFACVAHHVHSSARQQRSHRQHAGPRDQRRGIVHAGQRGADRRQAHPHERPLVRHQQARGAGQNERVADPHGRQRHLEALLHRCRSGQQPNEHQKRVPESGGAQTLQRIHCRPLSRRHKRAHESHSNVGPPSERSGPRAVPAALAHSARARLVPCLQ